MRSLSTRSFASLSSLATLASLATLGLATGGCAHTVTPSADRATRVLPQLVGHENLQRVEALGHTATRDGKASVDLRVCVAADGHADSVILERSSGSTWFDRAAVDELRAARYRAFPAPDHVRVCGRMQVVVKDG